MGHVLQLRPETVNEQQGWLARSVRVALGRVDVVQPVAVDIREAALGGHREFDLARDVSREENQADAHGDQRDESDQSGPRGNGHAAISMSVPALRSERSMAEASPARPKIMASVTSPNRMRRTSRR